MSPGLCKLNICLEFATGYYNIIITWCIVVTRPAPCRLRDGIRQGHGLLSGRKSRHDRVHPGKLRTYVPSQRSEQVRLFALQDVAQQRSYRYKRRRRVLCSFCYFSISPLYCKCLCHLFLTNNFNESWPPQASAYAISSEYACAISRLLLCQKKSQEHHLSDYSRGPIIIIRYSNFFFLFFEAIKTNRSIHYKTTQCWVHWKKFSLWLGRYL